MSIKTVKMQTPQMVYAEKAIKRDSRVIYDVTFSICTLISRGRAQLSWAANLWVMGSDSRPGNLIWLVDSSCTTSAFCLTARVTAFLLGKQVHKYRT